MQKLLIASISILLYSCTAQTYNFMSPNDPFLDSSRSISARLITGTACKEAQLTVRTYKNWMLGVSAFSNYSAGITKGIYVSRLSGEGLISYNIPLSKNKIWQMSIGGGYAQGENYVRDVTIFSSYVDQSSQTNYHTFLGQLGFNFPINPEINLKLFLKYNNTYFDYYFFSNYHGSPKNSVPHYIDKWEFKDKRVSMIQILAILKHSPSPYLSYFIEAGLSATSVYFEPEMYRKRVYFYSHSYITSQGTSKVSQPYYVPFFARIGIEFNIKRFSIFKKQQY